MDIDIFLALGNLLFLIGTFFSSKRENNEYSTFTVLKPSLTGLQGVAGSCAKTSSEPQHSMLEDYSLPRKDSVTTAFKPTFSNQEFVHEYAEFGFVCFGKSNLSFRASRLGNSCAHHADQGNLALIDNGLGVLIPTGSYGYRFGNEPRDRLMRKTEAHNLPLIGGQGQLIDDKQAIAPIVHQREGLGWCCKKIDLSKTYQGVKSFVRTFVFIEDKGLVIWDSVELFASNSLQWRLHSHLTAQADAQQVRLQEGLLQYECAVVSDNKVLPSVEFTDTDESYHLQWDFPATIEHNVVVSCLKAPLPVAFEGQHLLTIALQQGLLIVDNSGAYFHCNML